MHQYFDSDNSGTHANCVGDGIDAAFVSMAKYLREYNRIVLLAETGGGFNDESCLSISISRSLPFQLLAWGSSSIDRSRLLRLRALSNLHLASADENADVYLGYLG